MHKSYQIYQEICGIKKYVPICGNIWFLASKFQTCWVSEIKPVSQDLIIATFSLFQ